MIEIKDVCFVDLYLDDKPLEGINLVDTVVLAEGTAALFPSATMTLNDASGFLAGKNAVTDGNSLRIVIGKDPQDVLTYSRQYRLYNVRSNSNAPGSALKIMALYDAPGYTTASVSRVYKGNSSQALRSIADECKMPYSGPENFNGRMPNDSQSWMVACDTLAKFAQLDIARHGYLDEHSAMASCVTSQGEIRYRNLFDVIETQVKDIRYAFIKDTPVQVESWVTSYLCFDAQERSDAGLLNTAVNYGMSRTVHSLDGTSRVDSKVQVNTSGKYLAMNDQVAQTVKTVRHEQSAMDCGNVNPNYERAMYQNMRQIALFSNRVSVLVLEPTAVQLFEPVMYYRGSPDLMKLNSESDIYIVVGKTIVIKAGKYYCERIELLRPTVTEKGNAALKSAIDPGVSIDAAIPQSKIDPTAMTAASSAKQSSSALAAMMAGANAAAASVMAGIQQCSAAAGKLVSVVAAVQNATIPQMVTILSANLPKLDAFSGSMEFISTGLSGCTTGITAAGAQVAGVVSPAVKQMQVLMPGGALHCLAPSLGSTDVQQSILGGLNKSLSALSSGPGMAEAVGAGLGPQATAVHTALARMDVAHVAQTKNSVDMWNSSISHMTGTPIKNADGNMTTVQNTISSTTIPPEGEKYRSADSATSKLLGALLGVGSNKSPVYASAAGYVTKAAGFDTDATKDKIARLDGQMSTRKQL